MKSRAFKRSVSRNVVKASVADVTGGARRADTGRMIQAAQAVVLVAAVCAARNITQNGSTPF